MSYCEGKTVLKGDGHKATEIGQHIYVVSVNRLHLVFFSPVGDDVGLFQAGAGGGGFGFGEDHSEDRRRGPERPLPTLQRQRGSVRHRPAMAG